MYEYEVGDTVVIRDDLVVDDEYNGTRFRSGMVGFMGREMMIASVLYDTLGAYYKLKDASWYSWDGSMFVEQAPAAVANVTEADLMEVLHA